MATCAQVLATMKTFMGYAGDQLGYADNDRAIAYSYNVVDDYKNAILHITYALTELITAGQYTILENYPSAGEFPIPYYMENCLGGSYELSMDDIINTMLVADPDEVQYFIGLVDAYRQSIWNRPFNKEFFAALARGFMEWP